MKNKVLVLAGPTGIGKTLVATLLCRLFGEGGEIVSCDSVQVYRGLDIGSNKDTGLSVPQHLVDIVDWNEAFSAGDYYDRCLACIEDVLRRGKVPLIVGGTGFYMNWLLHGRPKAPVSDAHQASQIDELIRNRPWSECIQELERLDPKYAKTIAPNDYYRLCRGLAVVKQTGCPMSTYLEDAQSFGDRVLCTNPDTCHLDFRCFYLTRSRIHVAQSIDRRCEEMISRGFLDVQ